MGIVLDKTLMTYEASSSHHFTNIMSVNLTTTLHITILFLIKKPPNSMSAAELIAAVDGLAEHMLSGQQVTPDVLQMIMKWEDAAAIPAIQQVFAESPSPKTLFFISQCLEKVVLKYSPQWNDSDFTSLSDWVLGGLKARSEFLFQNGQIGSLVSDKMATVFGILVFQGWTCSAACQNFYQAVNNVFPPSNILCLSYGLRVLRDVVEYVAKNQEQKPLVKAKFKDEVLSKLFVHALNALRQGPIVENIDLSVALELADACLRFSEVREATESDEIIEDRCQPSVCFKDQLVSPGLYSLLFSIISGEGLSEDIRLKALSVVYHVCCIREAFYGTKENKMTVADCLCRSLASALGIQDLIANQKVFHKLAMILYKMRLQLATETTQTLDSYRSMLAAVKDATVVKIGDKEAFYDIHQALVYLLRFWSNCAAKDQQGALHEQLKPLFQEYINLLMAMASGNPERFREDILRLDEGKLCDEVTTVPLLLKLDFAALSRPLLDAMTAAMAEFLSGLGTPGNEERLESLDVKIALLLELISAALRNQIATKRVDAVTEYEVEFFAAAHSYLTQTTAVVPVMIERGVYNNEIAGLLFLKRVRDYVFDKKVSSGEEPCYLEGIGIPNVCAMYDWVVQRITVSLRLAHMISEVAVQTALNALENSLNRCIEITKNDKYGLDPMNVWRMLLQMQSGDDPIPFTRDFQKFRREIVKFMSLLTEAVLHSPSLTDPFVARMDAQFQQVVTNKEARDLYLLVLDLVGVFSNPGKNFEMLFRWLFPQKLEVIQSVIDQAFANEAVLDALLKLWLLIVAPDAENTSPTCRIQKQNHSADGIILFKMAAVVLSKTFTFLAKLPPSTDPNNDRKFKPMTHALRIYASIMDANYVMYGAFDLYNDSVLKDLLMRFIDMMDTIDMLQVWNRVKLSRAIVGTIKALLSRHGMTVLTASPPFFDCIIGMITEGYHRVDGKTVEAAVEAAKNLAEFLHENKADANVQAAMGRNADRLMNLVAASVEYLCNYADFKYPNHMFLRFIFILNPALLSAIHDQIRPQIPDQDVEFFEAIFNELGEHLRGLAESSDSGSFAKVLAKLRQFARGRNLTLSSR